MALSMSRRMHAFARPVLMEMIANETEVSKQPSLLLFVTGLLQWSVATFKQEAKVFLEEKKKVGLD